VFLELNGVRITAASNGDVYEFVMGPAAGHHEVDEIARQLESLATGGLSARRAVGRRSCCRLIWW
jgi:hypothetical protein